MNPTAADEKPRLLWANVLMFVLTMAGAVIVVPWYGFTHGYSVAAWVWFAVFLYANGLRSRAAITASGPTRTYNAHWSLRLVYMLLGAMALQNSILVWASGHRSHHQFVDDSDRDPYSASRGLWFSTSDGCCGAILSGDGPAMSAISSRIRSSRSSISTTTSSRSA
jgi:stearoyl-CoA desaturase (delta-9 desaturase)